jgi:hypothetical protein
MRIACWIPKATNTHSEYVIIFAIPLKQRLQKRASMFRYYVPCLPGFLFYQSCSTKESTTPVINTEADDAQISVTHILFCDFAFVSRIVKLISQEFETHKFFRTTDVIPAAYYNPNNVV